MDDIHHRAGQDAARYGVPLSASPFRKPANMPSRTGELPSDWSAKLVAWEAGWKQENEARLAELKRRRLQLNSD